MGARVRWCVWLLASLALGACTARSVGPPSDAPCNCSEPREPVPTQGRKLDILFMIDNSNPMEPKQQSLLQYFPDFIAPLMSLPGKPDLHIGIITSDLGAGAFTPPSCDAVGGDQGMLQNAPKGPTCTEAHLHNPFDRYLAYAPDWSGGAARNFTGDLADAFACYAAVGTGGCGFQHQLASVQAALDGCQERAGCTQQQNEGFFRKDAHLAVVIVTNEDDCSAAADSTLFDPGQTTLDSPLGPLSSYRCFEFGNLCNGADPGRQPGTLEGCGPGNKDPDPAHQLTPVRDFATFLLGLKPQDPRMVYLAVVAGPPESFMVDLNPSGYPYLVPVCTSGIGAADPATRLAELVSYFDHDRASFISICQPDLGAALARIGAELAAMMQGACVPSPLRNMTPGAALTPDCVAELVTVDATGAAYTHLSVPACAEVACEPSLAPGGDCRCRRHAGASESSPCWYVWPDPLTCPLVNPDLPTHEQKSIGSGYQIWIDRGTDAACTAPPMPPLTGASIQCRQCIANPAAHAFECSAGCAEHWPACCPGDGTEPPYGCHEL